MKTCPDNVRITRLCKECGKVHTIELRHNQFEDLLRYQANSITKNQCDFSDLESKMIFDYLCEDCAKKFLKE